MWFGILGAMEVRLTDGTPVAIGGPRVRALLALLLLDPGQVVTPERLIDGLYGEEPPSGAANALQSQVSRLRRGLRTETAAGDLVEFHPAGYRLVVDPDDVDAHRFERLAREGRRALNAGDHTEAATLLREAVGLWRGPALADVSDTPFAEAQVARLEELRVATVEDRVAAELALGGHRDVVPELQKLVAAHPLRERPRGLLMRALYGSGRQAEALAEYEKARRLLVDELGADPSPELAAVHLAILRAEPEPTASPAPGPSSAESEPELVRPRLPAQLTSFVGRTDELERIGRLLADARLVTLLGPGGAGKTRLAVEAGGRERDEVAFVDLAPLGDGADMPQAVLAALGLRDGGLLSSGGQPPDPTERLLAALGDRRVLLIMDNCEHVVADAARLAHLLLSECAGVRILATSREPLSITGETLRPLPPLASAPPGTPSEEAMAYPAVRLFADRAAAVRPGFAVTEANVPAVLRICGALDGLPLAIELAAARLRSLPVEQIVARLDDRFRLLSRGSRTAAPRHQTLRAVVEWSWDLLEEDERVLARRLTVFAGGFTFETASRVSGLDEDDVMDLLAGLVDKSLVTVADVLEDGGRRYNMLDTIRTFCAERLAEAGEEGPTHRTHAEYFRELAETAEPYLRQAEQLEWLARLDAERDNLHAALRWAVDTREVRLGQQLLAPVSSYWLLRGFSGGGGALAYGLLSAIGPEPLSDLLEEYALTALNAARSGSGGEDLAACLEKAASIVLSLNWKFRWPFLHLIWATYAGPPKEDASLAQAVEILRNADPWSAALSYFGTGITATMTRVGIPEGVHNLTRALEGFRSVGDRWGMAATLSELAAIAELRGDQENAMELMDEAIELAARLGAMLDLAELICRRADWRVRAGELDQAKAEYERAAEIARRAGGLETLALTHLGLGQVARFRGDSATADRLYGRALSEHTHGFSAEEINSRVYVARGWLAEASGDATAARDWHRRALSSRWSGAEAVEGLAGAAALEGSYEQATLLLGAGSALRGLDAPRDPDALRVSGRCREELGDAAYEETFRRGIVMTLDEVLALPVPAS